MKSSYPVSIMKREYFCICYRVHFIILKIKISIGFNSRRLVGVFFHLTHQCIKVSEKYFTMFVIKRIVELISFDFIYKILTAVYII